jgi:V/A-type H+-transporting ATPase subunit D
VNDMLDVNPTRGNMLRLKSELQGINTRHDLLDRKREVMIRELMKRMDRAEKLEEQYRDSFRRAHEAIELARMRMGSDRISGISRTPAAHLEVSTGIRTIMGLKIPSIHFKIDPLIPPYGLDQTSAALDEARRRWMHVLELTAQASETFTAIWRLAGELKKVQRQVNALETTIIPRYRKTIDFIQERLEEQEREEIVRAKKIQQKK